MDLQEAQKRARGLSRAELHYELNDHVKISPEHIAARVELDRRERRAAFWGKYFVAWLALGLSVIALVVSLSRG